MRKTIQLLVCIGLITSIHQLAAQKIEAENYSAMDGIQTENTSDINGGEQIGFINSGDWLEYAISTDAGNYDMDFRVATATDGGTIRILQNGTIIGHAIIEKNNDWDTWTSISIPVKFSTSDAKTIRLEFMGANGYLFNLNWFELRNKNLGTSSFTFDNNGKPTSLTINGKEILSVGNSFSNFQLLKFNGIELITTSDFTTTVSGNVLTVNANNESLIVKYRIDTYPRHVSMHLIDVIGLDAKRNMSIQFRMKTDGVIGHMAITDLVGSTFSESGSNYRSYWSYLHEPGIEGYRGGLVFWDGSLTGRALDETLAEIWTTESNMPKPAEQASWTESDILNWVDNYAAKFNNMTQMLLTPSSNADLYDLVDNYVIPNKVKQVYLHNETWRGEYWLNYTSRVHVNTNIFPNGEDDLKAFADYLHANDVLIHLHSLSFGIGKNDPDYILGGVDDRLGSWGKGKLEYAITSSDKVIYFRPDTGVVVPYPGISLHEHDKMEYGNFRMGEELLQCETVHRTDKEVWILSDCSRGDGGTDAFAFEAGEEMTGLYLGYGRNYTPGLDLGEENSLGEELTLEYATFVNEMGLDHLHFDGPRLNEITPYASEALISKVYSYTNRPTTASRVGGSIQANFELFFSQVKDDQSYNYFPIDVTIRLDEEGKNALSNSLFDAHFHTTEALLLGSRRVNLTASYHESGVTTNAINSHGLSADMFQLYRYLQELAPVFDDADIDYLSTMLEKDGNHFKGEYVNVLSKNSSNQYIYTPYLVLGESNGKTAPWSIYQELGAVPRKQTTATSKTLSLTNPEPTSDLSLIFHVSDATKSLVNPKVTLENGGYIEFTGTIEPGEYLQYEAGDTTATRFDKNWKVIATIPISKSNFIAVNGDFTALLTGTGTTVAVETQYYVEGTPYVLATNSKL